MPKLKNFFIDNYRKYKYNFKRKNKEEKKTNLEGKVAIVTGARKRWKIIK